MSDWYLQGLIERHVESTKYCSLARHMRMASKTYHSIMALDKIILPHVFKYLEKNGGGMNLLMLLQDLTKEEPKYEPKKQGAFVKYDVEAYQNAWLEYGREHKYI